MTALPTALIDFADPRDAAAPRLRRAFGTPLAVLRADRLSDVRGVLDAAEDAVRAGHWCVGYLRYEAAAAFDAALPTHPGDGGPLAWFGVHAAPLATVAHPARADEPTLHWQAGIARAQFDADLAAIQAAIAAGGCYQVNHTAPLQGALQNLDASGHAVVQRAAHGLFSALQRAQPGGYAAFIDAGSEQVLSVSPELFFDWRSGRILARPMKGTAPRGATPAADAAQAEALAASPKERAENVMVVDLLRNDLSRIAVPHSVRVPRLFATEALPSVWQMTSDVEAATRPGTRLVDVFAALFPCGSVTGAPKVAAMRMVQALEPAPRGVYCGAVGVLQPAEGGFNATFNVPIRTLAVRGTQVRCGIGSGIVAGADPEAEWAEWRHKRAFAERAAAPFELLETLALVDGQLRHAEEHLARMGATARHFGTPCDPAGIAAALQGVRARHPAGSWRVRLLLDAEGTPLAEAFALPPAASEPVRLRLAPRPFDAAHSEFVRFKTTRRAHYDAFAPTAAGVFDTVLWNDRQEVTETTRGNLALHIDGRWVTPALHSGLLPGIGRALALRSGRMVEGTVLLEDLARADAVAFVNSLRGWLPATLDPDAAWRTANGP